MSSIKQEEEKPDCLLKPRLWKEGFLWFCSVHGRVDSRIYYSSKYPAPSGFSPDGAYSNWLARVKH